MPPVQYGASHRHNPLEGCAWPDLDPMTASLLSSSSSSSSPIMSTTRTTPTTMPLLSINDVSGLNETYIERIYYPFNEQDVHTILLNAYHDKKKITVRGTQHSMGGHCMNDNGYVIDTKYLCQMEYHPHHSNEEGTTTVTVETGCKWSDVIQYINQFGKSPKTMQSYCTFSVGGTIAVNAHGITSDTTLVSDIVSFDLIRLCTCTTTQQSDGNDGNSTSSPEVVPVVETETITCTPTNEYKELFACVVGGYGLFGFVYRVTLKVTNNVELMFDSFQIPLPHPNENENDEKENEKETKNDCEFVRIWENCQNPTSMVQIKFARINLHTLQTASIFIFRRDNNNGDNNNNNNHNMGVVSNLSTRPRELSKTTQLLYKWALPIMSGYRFQQEERTGQAADMKQHQQQNQQNQNQQSETIPFLTTNDILFESATPLSRLYSPLVVVNDTFVLQEYFCPHDKFRDWIHQIRPIFDSIRNRDNNTTNNSIVLLNCTIRYVQYDSITMMNYSNSKEGMFAFVLYYRISKTMETDMELSEYHNQLAHITIQLGGTFYLPYRKCYSHEMLLSSYPQCQLFASLKEKYDPFGMFSNDWFTHYLLKLCSDEYQKQWNTKTEYNNNKERLQQSTKSPLPVPSPNSLVSSEIDFLNHVPERSSRRNQSYRQLLGNKALRKQFSEDFLGTVFKIKDPGEVMRTMTKATWDPRNVNDDMIYQSIYTSFQKNSNGTMLNSVKESWNGIRQLSHQKCELTKELALILHRLGMYGRVCGYVSMGDHGKLCKTLQEAGVFIPSNENSIENKCYILHQFATDDEYSIPVILERGALQPVGTQINYDYNKDLATEKFQEIPSNSVDLVTMNQGLHHVPVNKLYGLLVEVYRVLRPCGVFILREHNLQCHDEVDHGTCSTHDITAAPICILDLAHSIFNAITGVPPEADRTEIRIFRPILEWRNILSQIGFRDTMLYEVETTDPTSDYMMCFQKDGCAQSLEQPEQSVREQTITPKNNTEPHLAETFRSLLSQVPRTVITTVETFIDWLLTLLPQILNVVGDKVQFPVIPKVEGFDQKFIQEFVSSIGGTCHTTIVQFMKTLQNAKKLLEGIHIRETVDLVGLLSMPELFLIIPALQKKNQGAPHLMTDLETQLLSLVQNFVPGFLIDDKQSTEKETSQTIDSNFIDEEVIQQMNNEIMACRVPTEEVKEVILTLSNAIPGLLDPEYVLPLSEFNLRQQSALVAFMGTPDLDSLILKIVDYCDRSIWDELKVILVGSPNVATTDSVLSRGALPTKTRLLSSTMNHPWRSALSVFLQCPKIQLQGATIMGMKLLGLSELVNMYAIAKSASATTASSSAPSSHGVFALDKFENRLCRSLIQTVFPIEKTVQEVSLSFGSQKTHTLYDVGEIVHAEYGYKSLTSKLSNITQQLQYYQSSLYTKNDPQNELNHARGMLVLDEDTLNSFRNQNTTNQLRDSFRRSVVGVGSLGTAGTNKLKLQYRSMNSTMDHNATKVCQQLCSFMEQKRLIAGNIHNSDGHHSYYKLPEWMLVDILEKLSTSLDHTPWYFFPFLDCIKLYFKILFEECHLVCTEYGPLKAYGSPAFLTDLIPGVILSILFGQLQFMSYPLAQLFPLKIENSTSNSSTPVMYEEIICFAAIPDTYFCDDIDCTDFFQKKIDERIYMAHCLVRGSSHRDDATQMYKLHLPTYKTMGDILTQLAVRIPSARILQISGQKQVHVRIEIHSVVVPLQKVKILLNQKLGPDNIQYLIHYCYPNDQQSERMKGRMVDDTKVHLVVRVEVTALLYFIRLIKTWKGIEIGHIYEIWNGW